MSQRFQWGFFCKETANIQSTCILDLHVEAWKRHSACFFLLSPSHLYQIIADPCNVVYTIFWGYGFNDEMTKRFNVQNSGSNSGWCINLNWISLEVVKAIVKVYNQVVLWCNISVIFDILEKNKETDVVISVGLGMIGLKWNPVT